MSSWPESHGVVRFKPGARRTVAYDVAEGVRKVAQNDQTEGERKAGDVDHQGQRDMIE